MAVYRYQGIKSGTSKSVHGLIEADSDRDARRLLRQQNVYPTELVLERDAKQQKKGQGSLFKRNHDAERIVFTYQLSSLLEAGFTLLDSLQLLEEQMPKGSFRDATIEIRNDVAEGKDFSDALDSTQLFSAFYINLVKAGEASGALDTVLSRLSLALEEQQKLRSKVGTAMIYPALLLLASVGVLVFLMSVVVPNVVELFTDTEQLLPISTRILIVVSDLVVNWGWLILCALVLLLLFMRRLFKQRTARLKLQRMLLKWSFVRAVVEQRVCSTLALLLDSGVNIIPALAITSRSTGFLPLEDALDRVGNEVSKGDTLAKSLEATGYFSNLTVRMIHAGETAGSLEQMLTKIARGETERITRSIERFLGLLEPVIILLMGLIVGFVAVAVLMPIFEMNQLIS